MNPRLKRLQSDYDRILNDFSDHPFISVRPLFGDPPESYEVLYHLTGLRMDGTAAASQNEHIVRIALPAGYPRVKPVCTIQTPIWHPNFRDGQICIGDIWGAGETVSDIIVHIGDMIQYRTWNSKSPLSADAAHWALANKSFFPLGNAELWKPEVVPASSTVIRAMELESETRASIVPIHINSSLPTSPSFTSASSATPYQPQLISNDFEITSDELREVIWAPTPMQPVSNGVETSFGTHAVYPQITSVSGSTSFRKKIDFRTVFRKGILFGLIGGAFAWGVVELLNPSGPIESYITSNYSSLTYDEILNYSRLYSAVYFAFTAGLISLGLAFGEEIYRGTRDGMMWILAIRLTVGASLGFAGGFIAQIVYLAFGGGDLSGDPVTQVIARSIGWALVGISVGITQGLIPNSCRRIVNGLIGGVIGGFLGGLAFDFIGAILSSSLENSAVVSRAIAITLIGGLTGMGIGLVEQLTKQAWFKVVRGDFEGKEFILHQSVVVIGASAPSHIVLFKDKLVSPIHAEIRSEKGKYVVVDKDSANGTYVNGMRVAMHTLREGDMIILGNTAMIYHVKVVQP
jgi:ubiquitin-protein ligase